MPRICLRDSRLWFLPLIILSLLLEIAAPGAAQQREPGYHWGWHELPKTNRQEQKETRQKEAYDNYKLTKEKMNLERVKNGLEPRPIAPFEEWKKGMR